MCAEIELGTGTLGKAVSYPAEGRLVWHEKHPDTNEDIAGIRIPCWQEVMESVLNVARAFPFIRYAGWDVVVQNDGCTVIEANANSDVNLLQVHRPLLKDPRVRAFYKHHKVI